MRLLVGKVEVASPAPSGRPARWGGGLYCGLHEDFKTGKQHNRIRLDCEYI